MTRALWFRVVAVAVLAALGLKLGMWLHRPPRKRVVPVVTVHFLNIASGTCTVVKTPNNHVVVIDTGGASAATQVAEALHRLNVARIDLLILTSGDDSSVGGVPQLVASGMPISGAWIDGEAQPSSELTASLNSLQVRGIPVRQMFTSAPAPIDETGMTLSTVWPPQTTTRVTSDALVCRIDYGGQSCLLMGSLSASAEPYFIAGAPSIQADVLQVTDHGSGEGSALELLRRVQPEIAVISSTTETTPDPVALERLQAAGADIWRTDQQGDITVTLSTKSDTPIVTGSSL